VRKEDEMAVAVVVEIPGGTEEQYEQVASHIFPGGKLPAGWVLHLAGPGQDGWRVVNVVRSQDEFERFARETILPATREAGEAPPKFTYFPVQNALGVDVR
jgi:hypothetical protein